MRCVAGSLTMTQRAKAVMEMRMLVGLEEGEHITAQCKSSRMKKDHDQMAAISKVIDKSCNPFSVYSPDSLINIATGLAARKPTEE